MIESRSISFLSSVSVSLTAVILLLYLYLKYVVYNFWARKDIPHESPSILFGNVPLSYFKGKIVHGNIVQDTYMKFKKYRFYGLYMLWEPALVINDPELIRLVLVKNFNQFQNRGRSIDEHKDPLSASLERMNGDKWKRLRAKLTPAFTSGKLKLMYPLLEEICHEFTNAIDKALLKSDEIEIKEFTTRYTIDSICSIAFGIKANSLENADSTFLKIGKSGSYMGRIFILCSFFLPQLFQYMPVPEKRKQNQKFFLDFFTNVVEQRRKEKNPRNDFLDMIIQLLDYGRIDDGSTNSDDKFTEVDKLIIMECVAQSFLFFLGGLETTSSLITCCLYELALNPDSQEKLYKEVNEVQNSREKLTYEKLFDMQFLDMTIKETLRKYTPSAFHSRICTEDFKFPGSKLTIKKGMRVFIPYAGLHMNPDIYPEPEKFDPTRFLPENIAKQPNFTYLPFGDGPRQCIAKRLGILKAKIALFHLVQNYTFSRCEQTPNAIKYLPDHWINVPCDVPLKVEKRRI